MLKYRVDATLPDDEAFFAESQRLWQVAPAERAAFFQDTTRRIASLAIADAQ